MCVKDGGRMKLFLTDEGDLYILWWFNVISTLEVREGKRQVRTESGVGCASCRLVSLAHLWNALQHMLLCCGQPWATVRSRLSKTRRPVTGSRVTLAGVMCIAIEE